MTMSDQDFAELISYWSTSGDTSLLEELADGISNRTTTIDATLYRGYSIKGTNPFGTPKSPGDTITNTRVYSWSDKRYTANMFAGIAEDGGNKIILILAPGATAADVSTSSDMRSECEYLTPPETSYMIDDMENDGEYTVVHMHEIE